MGKWLMNQTISYIKSVVPIDEELLSAFGAGDPFKFGREFQRLAEDFVCKYLPVPLDWLWIEPRIRGKDSPLFKAGDVYSSGIGCGVRDSAVRLGGSVPRPDFIISPGSPLLEGGKTRQGFLIGEFKTSGMAFLQAYGIPGPAKGRQAHLPPSRWVYCVKAPCQRAYCACSVLSLSVR